MKSKRPPRFMAFRWLHAFFLGMREHKMDSTTHFDEPEINYYDMGRALAKHWADENGADDGDTTWTWVSCR